MKEVAIIGVGFYGLSQSTDEVSFKEGMYEAAIRAYEDCKIDPRKDVDSFICCEEDFWEGLSISDEFVPDQIGAVLRPTCTITSESLIALASAYMQIRTGYFDVVVVETHAKPSDILTYEKILQLSMDPIYERHLNMHPYYLASLEARYYMNKYNVSYENFAKVVEKNKLNGLNNPKAKFASKIFYEDLLKLPKDFDPLTKADIAPLCDAFLVFVLASKEIAEKLDCKPVWIKGVGWNFETACFSYRNLGEIPSAYKAAEQAYKIANIKNPRKEIDFIEVDDRFSYRELMHIEALRISKKGEAYKDLEQGNFDKNGEIPVNVSGGYLSLGVPLDAGGLLRTYEAILQLRKEAGKNQIKDVKNSAILSWRGITSSSYGVLILSNEGTL